jgi:alkanesulfonate monooxygenase SsuD/methylene tetrahydromethanopterin reductase-like flavin-dependent oxidoreductase (luciferase family)
MSVRHPRPLRLGVLLLPDRPWSEARRSWQLAEELGFDHAWTYDHLTWRGHRDRPWFGAMPTLTAVALTTTRLRFGPLVASPSFRHPVAFAKELITLDDISGGRLIAGLGAGGSGWDASMLGGPPWSATERTARFSEFVDLLDRLLRQPATDYEGRYYSALGARMHPGCRQLPRLPFAIAAAGPRAMRVAARHGQLWVTTGDRARAGPPVGPEQGAAEVRSQLRLLERTSEQEGRDVHELARLVLTGPSLDAGLGSPEQFADAAGRYAEAGATDLVVHWPRREEPYRADLATFERIFG